MRRRTYQLQVCLALIWGLNWPIAKIGLRDVPPFTFGVLRVASGLLLVVALLTATGRLRRPTRDEMPVVLSVAVCQIAAGIAIMNLALPLFPAGRASVLVFTMPLWVAAIEMAISRVGGTRREIGGLLLGVAGIGLLLNPQAIDWESPRQLLGVAGFLLNAVLWAVSAIILGRHREGGNPLEIMPWQLLIAFVPLAVGALVLDLGQPVHWEPASVAAVAYGGLLATGLAFWLVQAVSRTASPLVAAVGFLGIPVVGLLSSWILLGEPLSLLDLCGALATFVGIVMVSVGSEASIASETLRAVTAVD